MNKVSGRILFVSYTADWTGPTNSLLLLLKHLRHCYQVAVLLPGQGLFSETLAREGIPFYSLPALTKWSIPAMVRLIRRERFALVYCNNHSSSSRNALIAAKLTRVPVICHVREMGWNGSWQQMGYLRFAEAVIAVSQACAASLARFVPQSRLHLVYNGVQLSVDQGEREAARAHLLTQTGLLPEDVVIISLTHVCPRKGQEYAIMAIAEVVREAPTIRLLVVGSLDRDPAYVNRIHAMIEEMRLGRHVFLLGFRRDALQLLRGADLLLHVAVKDPHPRSVIEAMAMGLPVIAFAVDGVAETVVDGQTGYLVAKGDVSGMTEAILKLIENPSLRTQMGSAGKHLVKTHFSARVTAEKVARIIDSYGILSG